MKIHNPGTMHIKELRNLWQEAFGDTEEFLDKFFNTAFSTKRSMCITKGKSVLAALYWFDCLCRNKKVAYIYAVATRKSHRNQGLCAKLMESTHALLKEKGYKFALLVPGSKGLFGMYEKLGYKTCTHTDEFEISSPAEPCDIKKLSKEEYKILRRQSLFEDDVIQENENLDFLETFTEFYSGDDFLLACHKENNTLIVSELLGNKKKAESITAALMCKKGTFRTKGAKRAFSMIYDFSEGAFKAPAYFGLAFD